jgi:hypothetical protein
MKTLISLQIALILLLLVTINFMKSTETNNNNNNNLKFLNNNNYNKIKIEQIFNNTKCPNFHELQNPRVASNFNLTKFIGLYYELAFHDYTQFPTCPKNSCTTSNKKLSDLNLPNGQKQITDTFTLGCFSTPYPVTYYFNTTSHNGFLNGFLKDPPLIWKILFGFSEYPNTIVDYEENSENENGQYDWVIEMQCKDGKNLFGYDEIKFIGINFYSRIKKPSEDFYQNMINRARERGLGIYLDSNVGLKRNSMEDCKGFGPDE